MDKYYFTLKGFFFLYMPVKVPYGQVAEEAKKAGYNVINTAVLEKGASFGNGWVGVEIQKPQKDDPRIVKISGEFKSYLHLGSYKKIGKAFKGIMKEHPEAKEYYSLYLNSPMEVSEDELKTEILYR